MSKDFGERIFSLDEVSQLYCLLPLFPFIAPGHLDELKEQMAEVNDRITWCENDDVVLEATADGIRWELKAAVDPKRGK